MYVLDPVQHSTYFDEIRSIVAPDHDLTAEDMPNALIRQFSYLGRAETAVIRAANTTVAALRPATDDASAVPDTEDGLRKRELVSVIQDLTAHDLLEPQLLTDTLKGRTVTVEEIGIVNRRREIEDRIKKILPEVLSPSIEPGAAGSVISVEKITGTF